MRCFLVILSLIFVSCAENEFMGGADFDGNVWHQQQSVVIDFDTKNMVDKAQDINLFVRYMASAEGRDVTLYIKTQNSANIFYIDTLVFKLISDTQVLMRTVSVPYRKNVRWSTTGKHSMSIGSSSTLEGVMSVGVEIF